MSSEAFVMRMQGQRHLHGAALLWAALITGASAGLCVEPRPLTPTLYPAGGGEGIRRTGEGEAGQIIASTGGMLAAESAQEPVLEVRAERPLHRLSRYLTGACLEDVNHEVYGGLYSQMLFGESFQEPAPAPAPEGFTAFGGRWTVRGDELHFSGSPGDKLVSDFPPFVDGEVGVEIFVADGRWSNVGLIVRVANAGPGVDRFDGYEIALNPAAQNLRLGRHRQNWEPIKDTPCAVPVGQWVELVVRLVGRIIEARVNGQTIVRHDDGLATLPAGRVGLRAFQAEARYRNLWVKLDGAVHRLNFVAPAEAAPEVSGLWRATRTGTAQGAWRLETDRPFVGRQCQRLTFVAGEGSVGVENQGLNRWGLCLRKGRLYEGLLWARAEQPTELVVALESRDGSTVYASRSLALKGGDWERLNFTLQPEAGDPAGRFAVRLQRPGSVCLGYAFLQPGAWGRFKGLPVRRDVAEALVEQGITVLRYGGSMINHPEYRWKKMIGSRDRRPPYRGTWYPHSSNGWGILDFVEFCEAAGFLAIPAFNMDETPQDLADFVEYVNGPPDSPWGRRRVADGHPAPYNVRHLQLGNEERVDEAYFAKFKALAEAVWAKDTNLILVVGDFAFSAPITDPFNFRGAASGITSLAAHQKILRLAKSHNREVWFDVHVGTDGPRPDSTLAGMFSFRDALERIAEGARHQVVVFEFNAGNHSQRRALANALALLAIERDGRIPVATSANCLQPDGQNDNGWDQGLLFLNPCQVWLQPPGWVTRMIARHYQPLAVAVEVRGAGGLLDASAKRSEDGRRLVLQVVNLSPQPVAATLRLHGFTPRQATAAVEELTAPLDARNTAQRPDLVVPKRSRWRHELAGDAGTARYTFAAHSFTVLAFE